MIRYAFYSKSAAESFGFEIWITPDGKEVKVTGTDNSINGTNYRWTDKKLVGIVTKKK